MALIKMVNGIVVEMTTEEEAAIRADWAVGDHLRTKPNPLTKDEEMELLIQKGASAVQAARAEYTVKLASWQAEHAPIFAKAQELNQVNETLAKARDAQALADRLKAEADAKAAAITKEAAEQAAAIEKLAQELKANAIS